MQRLLLLGLNHTTAPLEVRERLAFNAAAQAAAVEAFRARFPGAEAVLLSTCNRVELYIARDTIAAPGVEVHLTELVEFIAAQREVPADQFRHHMYHKTGKAVVEHAFSVASSLDSLVLGETQILGQVREAYDLARRVGSAGSVLHPLFQRALAVGKEVRTDTALAEGRLSVASVAVEYAQRIFEHFNDKVVLCIGAGKMASLVLQHFAALSPGQLLVCNRDPSKAGALARRFNGEPVLYEHLHEALVPADIVVSSTGSAHPIITRASYELNLRRRRYRPAFLIDIAVPRDIEASVGELDNVYLYNLDDLQQVVHSTLSQRKGAIEAAQAIVAKHVDAFVAWHRQREMGPVIDRLYKTYHQLAREELVRTLTKLTGDRNADEASLEDMTRRIVNKLLHRPVQTLRKNEGLHAGMTYLHALERLFELAEERTDETTGSTDSPAEQGDEPEKPS